MRFGFLVFALLFSVNLQAESLLERRNYYDRNGDLRWMFVERLYNGAVNYGLKLTANGTLEGFYNPQVEEAFFKEWEGVQNPPEPVAKFLVKMLARRAAIVSRAPASVKSTKSP